LIYPSKLANWFLTALAGSKFFLFTRALPIGNGRSLQSKKFTPPPCQIPNFRIHLGMLKNKILLTVILFSQCLFAQTIAGKKDKGEGSKESADALLERVNTELCSLRKELEICYKNSSALFQKQASEEEYQFLLGEINQKKGKILELENSWRDLSVTEAKKEEDGYGFWDQEETTLAQLVMEYGAMDYVYIVPPEMIHLKLNIHSGIPVPRESWSEVLEIVLAHNGIGVKKINTYARQLYVFKQDPSSVGAIASKFDSLPFIPDGLRIFYLLSPPLEQVKSVFQFFERFADVKQTFIYQIGSKIAIVSSKEEVTKLLNLYNTVWEESKGKISRVVPVTKMGVREMEKILTTFFGEAIEKGRAPFGKVEQEGLSIFALGQTNALILIGQEEAVDRGEKIVKDTEEQLQDPSEMTVFIYSCKHSDPSDLAKVLEKVYSSLLLINPEGPRENLEMNYAQQSPTGRVPPDGYASTPPLVVTPTPLQPAASGIVKVEENYSDHFIPDPKTGNLLMVVRRDSLVKIKDLLRKLDVPKKMVQIEVLLFEKQLNTKNSFGLDFLKIGSRNGNGTHNGFNNVRKEENHHNLLSGLLEFMFKGHKSKHFPAYEVIYSFLMTQEDIQLNAAPSVITVNQTPAMISIVDEMSINNGAAPVDTNKGIAFEKSFTRAQYGITIELTPTVHLPDKEQECDGFITLQTDITFDTPKTDKEDRPVVSRRHIQNEVRVVDGQTVIIGGLRKKVIQDTEERVPFLGELPGIGMFFGSTKLVDHNTEMFFFITPTIILDPQEQLDCFRTEELKKRPGDIPEFLEKLVEARKKEEKKFFRNSMKMFFHDR